MQTQIVQPFLGCYGYDGGFVDSSDPKKIEFAYPFDFVCEKSFSFFCLISIVDILSLFFSNQLTFQNILTIKIFRTSTKTNFWLQIGTIILLDISK